MVHEYYEKKVRELLARRKERIEALKTRKDALAYVESLRSAVKKSFRGMPDRTPLRPRVSGRDDYGHYSLEKVIYESRPGLFVTGNLYLPRRAKGKVPCVLGVCGHANEGKACDAYQSFCQGLVLRGFAVFIIDPISQGERRQFFEEDGGDPGLCRGHNLMGNQMVLLDEFFGTWRVWDALRGLDYLLSRPEVDSTRVGVTGNSGGGTLSSYVAALDPRVTMAAPGCFICSYLANIENELPSDAEQNPPGIIAAGLDQVDLLLCHAPRPTLLLGQYDDFFDHRYTLERFKDMQKIHALLGARGNAGVFIGPRGHGYFQENREAMYAWFMKHAGLKGSSREEGLALLKEEKLYATSSGLLKEKGARRVFEFSAQSALELKNKRKKLSVEELRRLARKLLHMPKQGKGAPHYRPLRGEGVNGKLHEFAIETEPGIQVIATACGPQNFNMHPPKGKILLFVGNSSSHEDACNVPEIKTLANGSVPFLTLDPRGMGQSQPKTCGSIEFFEPYGSDFFYASTAEMLGESYLGGRVHDLLRTMDFLYAEGATEIELLGRGMGSIVVAFGALLHKSKPRARIINFLPSYQLIAESPIHKWPLSASLRGVLRHFDLPDIYRALGKSLKMESPWNANME
ncbi:MAG: hypothetical protein A2X49_15065 [Lentisphaerae bacterium GWF2_52_8]|nr:MAG: hypothetical protein A2X49_15065 [Lentisphaerae bacterium GWF2_52_8]